MTIFDSHCHIHDPEFAEKYDKPVEQIIAEAKQCGVERYICVGTSLASSKLAVDFADSHAGAYASLALHPHEVAENTTQQLATDFLGLKKVAASGNSRIVAIGECGLDYYYHQDTEVQEAQQRLFRQHIDLALAHGLPMIFHIRQAFEDFFAIIDAYQSRGARIRGVVHSFTAHQKELDGCLARGFYIGLNGIMTFTRDEHQLEAARSVPLHKLVLETDAPFLTPKPFRGKMCELKHIVETATFLSQLRGESLASIAEHTTHNAALLFGL